VLRLLLKRKTPKSKRRSGSDTLDKSITY
jgi:hypothetical protein